MGPSARIMAPKMAPFDGNASIQPATHGNKKAPILLGSGAIIATHNNVAKLNYMLSIMTLIFTVFLYISISN
jgi:hypothetical protein